MLIIKSVSYLLFLIIKELIVYFLHCKNTMKERDLL
ncbi:hypothetical protein BACOVA_00806 [Bacteroides ovatus ATCC 8483]|uniref:Uncharacterized protein n=1 Tax=Bacteroides ovatus (strain ATCC 8483 / DSM 1896 / JCM 5824 / BCRC 10623 / CCUG 4943 / NCTC 11153) TaxID=411476 RepID=A0AAN3ABK7_BACO1|nr:hypothetical protein BACOVA_00806 [Bacteroides ovatus ATCC 8483]